MSWKRPEVSGGIETHSRDQNLDRFVLVGKDLKSAVGLRLRKTAVVGAGDFGELEKT